ncbi:hypothetical protein RHMOL_Rhmol07G0301400 [Rhododendron molle]|uniref:Uncharacterized protein n=1 Tax=Rhododendron molle TaxID=49168 RepID=A0ACC0N726_RHOML|nr:hypothetical protein RHMOL_Rhmol07G0301400 [Rhododendron molle]
MPELSPTVTAAVVVRSSDLETPDSAPPGPKIWRSHPYWNGEEHPPRGVSERQISSAVEEIGESEGSWGR